MGASFAEAITVGGDSVIWDDDSRAVGVHSVVRTVRDAQFFEALIQSRLSDTDQYWRPIVEDHLRDTLADALTQVSTLVDKYSRGGDGHDIYKKLLILRHGQLAHRQTAPAKAGAADATDIEIETFYQDNLEIVGSLLHIVLATAYDLNDAASVHRNHATLFWAGARGEQTEGHPDYHRPLSVNKQ